MINTYNIRDLEVLSGIKSHTIRIWEQRYALLEPQRTDTNIRYYSDEDLKYLLQVALLNEHGVRISKIAEMSSLEIAEDYKKIILNNLNPEPQINGLVNAMIDMSEVNFISIIDANIAQMGLEKTTIQLIYPFLARIGMLWITNKIKPIQEHLMSNLVRQKIYGAINNIPLQTTNRKKILLFTPENELHEIGLLFSYFLLKQAGFWVYYVGIEVPMDNINIACTKIDFDYALTLLTVQPSQKNIKNYIINLSKCLHNTQLFVGGFQAKFISKAPSNIKVWHGIEDLQQFIKNTSPFKAK